MTYDTEGDLLAAARRRQAEGGDHLEEGDFLELKRELASKEAGNREIAKDLAAMALGGGTILVGVHEGPPAELTPILLAGQRERVETLARTVDPPVRCHVKVIRKDPPDDKTGYLVITVPQSDEAPHAVNFRFYGRFGTISAPLKHEEVRRRFQEAGRTTGQGTTVHQVEPTIDQLLDQWVQDDPTPDDQRQQAHVFVVARPRQARAQMLQNVVGTDYELWSRRNIVDGQDALTHGWSPDVGGLSRWWRVPGGWQGTSDHGPWQTMTEKRETHWMTMELREDGTVKAFSGRGSDHYRDGARVIIELIIAGTVRRAVEAAIRVSDATGYDGGWDVGVAVTNLSGAVSYFRINNWWVDAEELPPYPEDTYRETWTGSTEELRDADAVVELLVGPLNRVLTDGRYQLPSAPRPPEPEDEEDPGGEPEAD